MHDPLLELRKVAGLNYCLSVNVKPICTDQTTKCSAQKSNSHVKHACDRPVYHVDSANSKSGLQLETDDDETLKSSYENITL